MSNKGGMLATLTTNSQSGLIPERVHGCPRTASGIPTYIMLAAKKDPSVSDPEKDTRSAINIDFQSAVDG